MPKERSSFTPPVEPISPPPKPVLAHWPDFGGGAGYRPRVRRAYFEAVYPHIRSRRQNEYKHFAELYKSSNKLGYGLARDRSLNHSEISSKAKPYGLLGLFLSLLAICGLTALFCGLTAIAAVWIAPFTGESEFFASVTALARKGAAGISGDALTGLGYASSYAIYGGLGFATFFVAFFRARTAPVGGGTDWEAVKELTAFLPPLFKTRLLIVALMALLYRLTIDLFLPRFYPAAADRVTLPQGTGKIAMLYILVVVVAPFIEELVFRGWIFTSLRASCGFWVALLGTASLFSFLHYEQTHLYALAVFPLGLALGLMREWSGSIKPAIAFHALYNLSELTLGLLE